MKSISFSNRTRETIPAAFANLKKRYGKKVHYGSIDPQKGNSALISRFFIVYL